VLAPVQLTDVELCLIKQHFHGSKCEQIRTRCHAIYLSSRNYSLTQIAEILFISEGTVFRYLKAFSLERIASLFPKSLGNQHAAKLTKEQKQQLKEVLSKPPSKENIPQEFWDIFALKTYIKAEFKVEYESDESYRLLFLLHNYSFHLPDTFDRHRNEKEILKRMRKIKKEIKPFQKDPSWQIFAADECRIVWETEIRRLWLPKGEKTIIKVERKRRAQSFLGLLNLKTGEDLLYKLAWQKQDEIIPVLEELINKYPNQKVCIIWDNARFHHGKKIKAKLSTTLKHLHLINFPPYAPDHNPQEHVWKYGKEKIANNQRESLEETVSAFTKLIAGRTFNYEFS